MTPYISRPYVTNGCLFVPNEVVPGHSSNESESLAIYYESSPIKVSVDIPISHGLLQLIDTTQTVFRHIDQNEQWAGNIAVTIPSAYPCEQYILINGTPLAWPLPGQIERHESIKALLNSSSVRPVARIVLLYLTGDVIAPYNNAVVTQSIGSVGPWRATMARVTISKDPWEMQRRFPEVSKLVINPCLRHLIVKPSTTPVPSNLRHQLTQNMRIEFKVSIGASVPRTGSVRLRHLAGRTPAEVYRTCVERVLPPLLDFCEHGQRSLFPRVELTGITRCCPRVKITGPENRHPLLLDHIARAIANWYHEEAVTDSCLPLSIFYVLIVFPGVSIALRSVFVATRKLRSYIIARLEKGLRDENDVTVLCTDKLLPMIDIIPCDEEHPLLVCTFRKLKKTGIVSVRVTNNMPKPVKLTLPLVMSVDKNITSLPIWYENHANRTTRNIKFCLRAGLKVWLMTTCMSAPHPIPSRDGLIKPYIMSAFNKALKSALYSIPSLPGKPFDPVKEIVSGISLHPGELRTSLVNAGIVPYYHDYYNRTLETITLPTWLRIGCLCTGSRIYINLPSYTSIPLIRMMVFGSLVQCGCEWCMAAVDRMKLAEKVWYVLGPRRTIEKQETHAELLSLFATVKHLTPPVEKIRLASVRREGWVNRFHLEARKVCPAIETWLFNAKLYPKYTFMASELFLNMQGVMCLTMPTYELGEEVMFNMFQGQASSLSLLACEPHTMMCIYFIHEQTEGLLEDAGDQP